MSKKPDAVAPEVIVGVDDGFAMTKVVVMSDGKVVKQLMIPSRARAGVHGTTVIGKAEEGEINARYETDGGSFTVENISGAESARFDEYPFSPMNRSIVHHALRIAGLGGKVVKIGTGLPLGTYYKGVEADLEVHRRKDESMLKPVRALDDSACAKVIAHSVFPEGLAAWVDYAIDGDGNITQSLDESVGVIDIGGRTTDIAVILPGRRIDHARCGSADLGALNVIEEIAAALKKAHNVSYGADKIEPALRSGEVKIWGKVIDIRPMIEEAARNVIGSIKREVNRRLGNAADLDKVLLVGGGAHLFRGVADAFPNVHIPDEPEFSNARGFAKYLSL